MDYDALLKYLLQRAATCLIPQLTGSRPKEQLSVEFPSIEARHPDLLILLEDGRLLHIELQSRNDPTIHRRMLRYWLVITERYPDSDLAQFVLYFGNPALNMPGGIATADLTYRFGLLDIRSFDPQTFLDSPSMDDHILAFLGETGDPLPIATHIVQGWMSLPHEQRLDLFLKLVVASGLRGVRQRIKDLLAMPIEPNLKYENAWYQVWSEEGRQQGELTVVRRLLTKRFGLLPEWAEQRLQSATPELLEHWSDRLLDASSLDEVFR